MAKVDRRLQQKRAVELAAILGRDATRHLSGNPCKVWDDGVAVSVHDAENITIELCRLSGKVAKAVLRALAKSACFRKSG